MILLFFFRCSSPFGRMVSICNAQFVGICRCENIYFFNKKKKKKHNTRLDRAAVNFILCVSFISNMNNEYVGIHFCGDTSNERKICIFCILDECTCDTEKTLNSGSKHWKKMNEKNI